MLSFESFPNFNRFKNKNILAIDFGTNVIGLAVFTPGREPYPISRGKIINESENFFLNQLKDIIDEDSIEVIVFGIPYYTDGKESDKTREHKILFEKLKLHFSTVQFFEQNETLTTEAAKERMRNNAEFNFKVDPKKIDEVSAIIILEDFIREI